MNRVDFSNTVTVVVVAFRGERWLGPCLQSLAKALASGPLILVDNGEDNHIERLPMDRFNCAVLRTPTAMGFAEANNYALVQCSPSTDTVCFLNQDTISESTWLHQCLEVFARHDDVGAVMPVLRSYDGLGWDEGFLMCARDNAELHRTIQESREISGFYPTQYVTAAAMIVRTEALKAVGPFDPIFGSYYEDFDLCLRLRHAGWRVGVCGEAQVRHFGGSSSGSASAVRKRTTQIIRNRAILRFRDAGRRRLSAIAQYALVEAPRNILRSLLGTPSSQPFQSLVRANLRLLQSFGRLSDARRDDRAWQEYLREIGWESAGLASEQFLETGSGTRPGR